MSVDPDLEELFSRYEETYTDYDGVKIVDVNQPGEGEDKLLHLAANHSDIRDVSLLLKYGANVNEQGDIGLTALHYAASKGKLDIVKLLVRHGANTKTENEFGESALDWARNCGAEDVVAYLESLLP